jgi:hypothetical protein
MNKRNFLKNITLLGVGSPLLSKGSIESVLAQSKNTQATLEWTESQLQNHKQSIEELFAEIDAMKRSKSWRVTAPLRKLFGGN